MCLDIRSVGRSTGKRAGSRGGRVVGGYGEALAPDYLSRLVIRYIKESGVGKSGGCHLFRHTCATLMLENGADTCFIQQLLGHANLGTTQIYTNVSINQLQKVHEMTHPAKKQNPSE